MKLLSLLVYSKTGLTLRKSIQLDPDGDIAIIQPRDIDKGIVSDDLMRINSSSVTDPNKYLLQDGEILIANKGVKFAVFLFKNLPEKYIASGSFFVLSVKHELCLPEYLVWFLNQQYAKDYFLTRITSTAIPSLSKSALDSLPVLLPSLKDQQKIVDMSILIRKEQDALTKMAIKMDEFLVSYSSEILQQLHA